MGGELPAEIMSRIRNRPPEMMAEAEKQSVANTTPLIAYAVLQTMLSKDLKYRSSRLDDMGKSPLPDWIDIGIAAYASGNVPNAAFLQQHMDQTFPIEDVIAMSRPFVASSTSDQGGGGNRGGMGRTGGGEGGMQGGEGGMQAGGGFGQGGTGQGRMPQGGFSGRGMGGGGNFGGNGGQRGGGQRNIPKDEQDRMLFDAQAGTLFAYLIEKIGIDKVKQLVKQAVEGKESRDFIIQPDVLGPDFEKIEEDWVGWVKNIKVPQTQRQGFQAQF